MAAFVDRYGPWAVVAGASTGLGAAFADGCAARGLNVVVLARRAALLEETAVGIRDRHGVEVRAVTLDMADADLGAKLANATDGLEVGLLIYNGRPNRRARSSTPRSTTCSPTSR